MLAVKIFIYLSRVNDDNGSPAMTKTLFFIVIMPTMFTFLSHMNVFMIHPVALCSLLFSIFWRNKRILSHSQHEKKSMLYTSVSVLPKISWASSDEFFCSFKSPQG